ncbi:uncharacterized protein LOC112682329 isoform X2 [Sipha flava]|uniref:Uncharacterized protein LOC112682329 isoform X2 n=1 Tax=Sipha flava TaxID=143950 RepID=A0A8B8FDK0_9HEMI|nr:uncharacterized protein LOC112682329 isoform X2 [Sipha flava]
MRFNTHKYTMEIFWHSLLIGCVMTATVYGLNDVVQERVSPNTEEYRDDTVTAEDHEHHRIIIVVPKEIPHHVNHVHTYKLAGKGIPLIHSGKVVHDHKHSGKVAHEHGHKGKSSHTHKHVGKQGHQHKHLGYLGHHHYGKFIVTGGHHKHHHLQQAPIEHHRHHPLLHTAAHKLHLQHQQHLHHKQQLKQSGDYLVQQHGGGSSGIYNQGQHGGPTSGRIQFIPSSKPQGLGSFIPAEIQQYIDGRHGVRGLQQQQQYEAADDGDDDHEGQVGPPAAYNVIHLRVPGDQGGPNIYKQVDIDLANNVAKLQPGDKQQPGVTANFKRTSNSFTEHFPSHSTYNFQISHSP